MSISLRRLTPDDWALYRDYRLEALKQAPLAFRTDFSEESAKPDAYWQDMIHDKRPFFAAFDHEGIVGSVNFVPETGPKVAHKGWLVAMYVSPRGRGTGAALKLIEMLIAHVRTTDVRQIHLGVGTFNETARRLYQKAGFVTYGTEPGGELVDGELIDEDLMVKFLDHRETRTKEVQ